MIIKKSVAIEWLWYILIENGQGFSTRNIVNKLHFQMHHFDSIRPHVHENSEYSGEKTQPEYRQSASHKLKYLFCSLYSMAVAINWFSFILLESEW